MPFCMTSGISAPLMKNPINFSGRAMNSREIIPRKIMFPIPTTQAERSARPGWSAPRFCPTRVAAALAIPHEGNSTNITIRMAMVYPATASSPRLVTTQTRKIHEEVAMRFCPMAPRESFTSLTTSLILITSCSALIFTLYLPFPSRYSW